MKLVVIVLFISLVAAKAVDYPNLGDELYNHKLAPVYRMKKQADDVVTDIRKIENKDEENWRALRETEDPAKPSEVEKKEEEPKNKAEDDRSTRDVATDTSGKSNDMEKGETHDKTDAKGLKRCWRFAGNSETGGAEKVEKKEGKCDVRYSRSVQIDENGISEEDSKIARVLRSAAKARVKPNKGAKRAKGKAKATRLPRNPTDDDKESKTKEQRKEEGKVRIRRDTAKSDDKESKVEEQPKGKRDAPEDGDKKAETEKKTKREDGAKVVDEKQGKIEQPNAPKQEDGEKTRRSTPTEIDKDGKVEEQPKEKSENTRFLRDTLEKIEEKAEGEETGKKSVRFLRESEKNDDKKQAEDQGKKEEKNRVLRDTQEVTESKGGIEEKKGEKTENIVRMLRNTLEETKDADKTKGQREDEKKKETRSAQEHNSCDESEEKIGTCTKTRRNAPEDTTGLRSRFLRDTPEETDNKESRETQEKGEKKTVRRLRDAPEKPEGGVGDGKVEEQQTKESKNVRFSRTTPEKTADEGKNEEEGKIEEQAKEKSSRLARDVESTDDSVKDKQKKETEQKEERKNVRLVRNTVEGNGSDKKEAKNKVYRQVTDTRDDGTCKDFHKKFRRETVEDTKTGTEEKPKEEKTARINRNSLKHEDHFCQWKDDDDKMHQRVDRDVAGDTKSNSDGEKERKQ